MLLTKENILKELESIADPEIPALNIVEMGIVREVILSDNMCKIKITPTYSGCPAMNMIEDEIKNALFSIGINNVNVVKVYSPAWSTDWFSEETKNKLQLSGIAPPEGNSKYNFYDSMFKKNITCPYCKSNETNLTSEFGSTSCKSLHFCDSCQQPFEHFKCI
jgi:ring-1,2-phenylacetyl-CoA epoxidase subunit PaaD